MTKGVETLERHLIKFAGPSQGQLWAKSSKASRPKKIKKKLYLQKIKSYKQIKLRQYRLSVDPCGARLQEGEASYYYSRKRWQNIMRRILVPIIASAKESKI